jgi:hypothetical protein
VTDKRSRVRHHEAWYLGEPGFEPALIEARQNLALEVLAEKGPGTVVEIGCGAHPLYERASELANRPREWVIVEPGEEFGQIAEQASSPEIPLHVIHGFFEDQVPAIHEAIGGPPDFAVCLALLQAIPDPVDWLRVIRGSLARGGWLLLGVPNALSFHRRLARAMGLIADERELSERDRRGFHQNVFDMEHLHSVTNRAGFTLECDGGYFIKPFTHAQMERVGTDVLTPEVLDGLWTMGRMIPELASEIYVLARA